VDPILLIIGLPILLYSAILHEIAHGLVADRLGDPTARLSGRLTLNPIPHIDLYMSILLPALLIFAHSPIIFGGAKPVPIDPYNLKEGKKDIALVALSGPLTNLLIAIIAAGILHLLSFANISGLFMLIPTILLVVITLNIYLAIFNLLPIPPLDGSKVFSMLLPDDLANTYLSIGGLLGILILFLLLSYPIGGFFLPDFMQKIYRFIINILGVSGI